MFCIYLRSFSQIHPMNEWIIMNNKCWECCGSYSGSGSLTVSQSCALVEGVHPIPKGCTTLNHHRTHAVSRLLTLANKCRRCLSLTLSNVADISPNCRPTFFDSRPITVSVTEVSHAHTPRTRYRETTKTQ